MRPTPASAPATVVAFDSPAYADFVADFVARIRARPITIVLAGPSARQRGAVLADLSDVAHVPLHVVPMETRFAGRVAGTLANLREDFDATSTSPSILCFRHADRFLSRALTEGEASFPAPFDYIFERARHVKGAVVLSLDDAAAAEGLAGRANVVVTFEGDGVANSPR